ncbi:hypothetical protein KIH31_12350 [Paenarthrobacter sp. DKR-5]|nr:hypothetical protein [Paenarthrobacter sp. DKR-5]
MQGDGAGVAGAAPAVAALAGHNRISTQALTSLAQAATAEALGVPAQEVRVFWSDDGGDLALAVGTPVTIPRLADVLRDPGRLQRQGGSVLERAVAAKAGILRRVTALSGAHISRVDIRLTGARVSEGGRVR